MTSELEIQYDHIMQLQRRVVALEAIVKSYAERDTVPPPPDTLVDTADLSKDADIARKINEIHQSVSDTFVPLRTDMSELSLKIGTLTDALVAHTDNELRIEARLTRIERHLALDPLPEKADD
jgi:hypothetical protein